MSNDQIGLLVGGLIALLFLALVAYLPIALLRGARPTSGKADAPLARGKLIIYAVLVSIGLVIILLRVGYMLIVGRDPFSLPRHSEERNGQSRNADEGSNQKAFATAL